MKGWRRGLAPALAALAASSLGLTACGSAPSTPGVDNVVAAEVQYGDVLAQIGGPYVHVTSIMTNPNTDPHNFEASSRVARAIASARLVVQNGAGYDAFMNTLESGSPSASRVVISVARLRGQTSAANPHFWYAPDTMTLVARAVAEELATLAPAHAAYFHSRASAFAVSWRRVSAAVASARRRVTGYAVATTEPVGDYLLAAMGLDILTPFRFQADVMNGIDPSPQDIVTQENLIVHHRVDLLVYNAQVASAVTTSVRDLAVAHHVPTVAIDEIMPPHEHVQTWLLSEIGAIVAALPAASSTGASG